MKFIQMLGAIQVLFGLWIFLNLQTPNSSGVVNVSVGWGYLLVASIMLMIFGSTTTIAARDKPKREQLQVKSLERSPPPPLTNCPNCGKEIQDQESSFCKSCGAKLKEDRYEPEKTRYHPFRPLTYVCLPFGICLIGASLIAAGYEVTQGMFGYGVQTYPYSNYAFPLAIIGILSLIISIVAFFHSRTK